MSKKHSQGVALVAVIWITGLLALIAASTGSSGRVSSHIAFNAVENAKARLLAEGGVYRAVYHLLGNELRLRHGVDGSLDLAFQSNGNVVNVRIRDEDGKIDVNQAGTELLAGLIAIVSAEASQSASSIAANIVDFRDEDGYVLPNGAEHLAYEAAGLSRGPANRSFRNLEELKWVLGMDEALYEQLRPHLTVYSKVDGIDPFQASDAALSALPGMTPALAAAIRSSNFRDASFFQSLPGATDKRVTDHILPSRNLIFEVRALARTEEGGLFLQEAVITLESEDEQAFSTLFWRRGRLYNDDPLLSVADGT